MKWKMKGLAMLLAVGMILVLVAPAALAGGTILTIGSQGSDVQIAQSRLKQWGYYSGTVDGLYGPLTAKAVKYFQSRNKLTADGIIGPITAAAIGITLRSTATSSSGYSYTQSELNLLAKVVYAEARGEPYLGQVAVAAVVMNRIQSSDFPDTISGVIYQRNAFSCVSDGQINLTANSQAYQAAREALNGTDPSNGALYYYNPDIATSTWILSRQVVKIIGNHYFAK